MCNICAIKAVLQFKAGVDTACRPYSVLLTTGLLVWCAMPADTAMPTDVAVDYISMGQGMP